MTVFFRRQRWVLLSGIAVLVFFISGILWPAVFGLLGINESKFIFFDLIAILAAGEASAGGWDVYLSNPLDPGHRPHVYGPWWLMSGDLGLVRSDTWWVGMLIVAAFMVTSVALLAPRSWRMFLVTLGLMLSPPVMLALERCNNDLIIFLLMVGAAWLVTRRFLGGMFAAAGLIVLAAALKLYPIVTLPTLAVRAVSRRWAIWLVFTTGVVCALVVLNSLEVYHRVSENAPEPITIFAYGGKISYYMLKAFPLERVTMLVGGIPLVFAAIWICWRCRRAYWDLVPATGFTAGCFLAGALAWIICYCGTTNFSYRLLLLLLPARLLLSRKMRGTGGVATRFLLVAILLFMWTPCSKHHLLQLNGVERFYGGSTFVWMTLGFEYALGLVISVMLGLALTGWAWRRFREEHV